MIRAICCTCGTQFADGDAPPPGCPICEDERQYVRWGGQAWTTLEELRASHRNSFSDEGGLTGVGVEPSFAIGQRALVVPTDGGCVLWDCVSLVTPEAVERVRALGGLRAIAISHPHYYTAMGEWSDAFGGVAIHLHADDRQWIMRPHPAIRLWSEETLEIAPGLTLIRCGGHFAGATVLHWAGGAEGRGALLVGDVLQVAQDRRYLSFMYSYPNYIPLNRGAVTRIARAVEPFAYDRIYGAWRDRNVLTDGKAAVARSVERYLAAIR